MAVWPAAAAVFVIGALLVLGAQVGVPVAADAAVLTGMRARFLPPLVLSHSPWGPDPWRSARSDAARVPVAVAIVPVFVALGVTIAFRMYSRR